MDLKKDKEHYLRLIAYMKPHRKRFFISVLSSIPASSLNGVMAFAAGPLLDRLLKEQDYMILLAVPALVFTAMVLQGVFEYINGYTSSYLSYSISRDIQQDLFNKLITLDLAFFKSRNTGEIFTRFYTDCNRLQQAIVSNLQDFSIQVFSFLFLAGVLFYRNWQFAFISIAIISMICIPLYFISQRIRRLDHQLREVAARMVNIFSEYILGVKEIKSFQLNGYQKKRFEKTQVDYFSSLLSSAKAGMLLRPLMQLIAATGFCTIFILGLYQVRDGHMSIGDFTSFLLALVMLYKPVKTIGGIFSQVQRIMAPAERVFELLDTEPGMVESSEGVQVPDFESLEFRNVWFEYKPGKPVLKDINFSLKQGEVLALVGASGGGKTTLADMVSRFMDPTEGEILLNGLDLKTVSVKSLRRLIGLVSQETLLFDATIRENIRLGRLDATDEEIEQAARDACLGDWIDSLADGLDTKVGERGGMVSGGQKQRIALARAFLKRSPVLVLDEATSALDNESEALIQEATKRLMENRTVIVIAHRLSTVRYADRILVLSDGQVIETGSHDELLEKKGMYHKLYHLQFRHEEPGFLERLKTSAGLAG